MRENLIWVAIGAIMIFCVLMSMLFSSKTTSTTELENIINGNPVMSKRNLKRELSAKLSGSSFYIKRMESLNYKIAKTYNQDLTAEYITKWQFMSVLGGLGILILAEIIFSVLILNIIVVAGTFYLVFMYDLNLNGQIKAKNLSYDNSLPLFEMNMLLGLQSNASLPNAMELAIQTLPEGLVKIEFQKLLLDISVNTDNIALCYLDLSKRVPTKDNERFCNIVISGLKNGNSMSQILENESEYMQKQMLNKIREANERNMTKASLTTSAFVFLPLLVIFLAPMMMTSM